MPPMPEPSQWLVFIPLSGLVLTGEQNLQGSFLFGDVTVISCETFLKAFASDEDRSSSHDYHGESYLVIRRRGVVNTRWFDEDRINNEFMAGVRSRAKQIASLLTLAFLATSDEGVLVGLSDQLLITRSHFGIHEVKPEGRRLVVGESGPLNETFDKHDPETPTLSWEDLEEALRLPLIAPLTHVFESSQTLDKSLRDSLVQSSVRLATAIHATSYTEQLLGAVTTIEILLSGDEQTTFKMKETRLATLIGLENAKKYEFKQVLRARHSYVHSGEDITDRRLPLRAICAAIQTLLVYAQLAHKLKTKNALLHLLDIANLGGKLNSSNPGIPVNLDSVNLDLILDRHPLPFADFVEGVIEGDEDFNAGLYDRLDRVFGYDDFEQEDS